MEKIKDVLIAIGFGILLLIWFQPIIVGVIDFTWTLWTGHSLLWNWTTEKFLYLFITTISTAGIIGSTSI